MTPHCSKCGRPLIRPTKSGMGRVCEKKNPPVQEVERTLFGYDIEAACAAALLRVQAFIEEKALHARIAIREFRRRAEKRAEAAWHR